MIEIITVWPGQYESRGARLTYGIVHESRLNYTVTAWDPDTDRCVWFDYASTKHGAIAMVEEHAARAL